MSGGRAVSLPETLGRINAELRARRARSECTDIADFDAIALADEDGPYLRITFRMRDGSTFDIDTAEGHLERILCGASVH